MHCEEHHDSPPGDSPPEKISLTEIARIPAVFYLPVTRISVSKYAELTGQNIRAVSQQIRRGKLPLSVSASRERQINMLSLFLQDYNEAMCGLYSQGRNKQPE